MSSDTTSILLVDDLPEKLLVYRSILEELGQTIVTAHSGEEALGHVLATDFAVILMDVNMPRMSGFEAAALIRKRKKSAHTPIIFLTAFADEVRAAEGYAHGAVDYISTPAVPAILRAKVRVFVELYRMTQQVKRQADERVALAEERTKRAAAEAANYWLQFLTRTGALLGQSLDRDVAARNIAGLAVPVLADAATLVVARGGARAAVTASRGDEATVIEEGVAADALDPHVSAAADKALAGGVTVADDERSLLAIPLAARGQTFAALVLSRAGRPFAPADETVARAYASRAEVALDNAQLHHEVEDAGRQKNEFLSMLAHELRNPLAPIRNAAEVLQLCGTIPERVEWARGVIDRQLGHMVRLVDDLLDISRITQGKIRIQFEPVELGAAVAAAVEATRPLIDRARHTLEVSVPHPVRVTADPTRLTQVVANLLSNAAKYTPDGGTIRLSVEADGGSAVVRIGDTGVGIAPNMLASVFDLFTQVNRSLDRSQGGLGVGLTLVRRLVELHGGTVEARSEGVGRGSEFVVRLPRLAADAAEVRVAEPSAAPPTPAARRLVLIDDHADGVESLADLLRFVGHEVAVAYDGSTGIEAVRRTNPDAVVLDIGLPGMSGYEVAKRLRADPDTARVSLIAVSGYGRDEDRRASAEAGFDHHFVKPVELAVLRRYLASLPRR